ncbi:MAG: type 4a pilus biogenesis protein PilO [bacterium]|nr:type 4a pilus biogenesis protein PilO [bacterium]
MAITSQIQKTVLYYFFKNPKFIIGGIIVLVLLLGWSIFLAPKYESIQNQGLLDYDKKQDTLTQRQSYLSQLQELADEYRAIDQAAVENVNQVLPSEQQLPELFVMLEAFAEDAGLTVERITLTPQGRVQAAAQSRGAVGEDGQSETIESSTLADPTQVGEIGIVMGISVTDFSYAQFKNLMQSIEQNIRLFDLNTVNYAPGTQSFVLNMTTYYLIGG